jgi:hypothetical protein
MPDALLDEAPGPELVRQMLEVERLFDHEGGALDLASLPAAVDAAAVAAEAQAAQMAEARLHNLSTAPAPAAGKRRRRADLVRKLRADAAALRAELNALRSPHKLPTDPEKLVKYRKLLPLYQELKERLAGLDA